MAEEQFIQMYVRDFAGLAARSEAGSDVGEMVTRRVRETRTHAELMDARKEPGHLAAVAERLRAEARRVTHALRGAPDPVGAAERRQAFLFDVAERLETAPTAPTLRGVARF